MPFTVNPNLHILRLRSLLCLAAIGLMPGCAQVYTVKVDALRSPERARRSTYRLESLAPERATTDPQYPEVASLVESALGARGLFPASRPEWADIVVEIDYGIGPCHMKAVENGDNPYGNAVAVFYPDHDGEKITEATGTYVPTAALKRVVAVWDKKLSLAARENTMGGNTNSNSGAELWRVNVVIEDESASIEESLPVLAAALIEHIDSTSEGSCVERISAAAPAQVLLSENR